MTKLLLRVSLAASVAGFLAPAAQAQIYRCQSPDGTPLYQNSPGKNCKPMDLPSLTTIPSPRTPAPAARATTANAAPTDVPRVDASAQRSRDSDRKRILEDELGREQARLEQVREEYNGGEPERLGNERNYQKYLDRVARLKDDITRSETSVASLRRELEGVK
ncbi:MAG TPA: DUF4124 domain-containing protein [Lautropia sp.]|jgi:hypothetical protein|nr:DUF4124 domain-containing protein [Lautropia sp.]